MAKIKTKPHKEASINDCTPHLWNSLPDDLRAAETAELFKAKLKSLSF